MLQRVTAINASLLAGHSDDGVAQLAALLDALQRQALQLMDSSTWPKADRRLGGSRRLKVSAAWRKR